MPLLRAFFLFLVAVLVACAPAHTGDVNTTTPRGLEESVPDADPPEQRPAEQSPGEVEPDEPQGECRTNADCTTASIGPDCCPSCFSVGYSHERLAQVREHCAAHPELRQSCPALGCAFQHGMAICHEGRCQATSPEPAILH